MNLTFMRSYSVESQLTFWGRGHDAIAWSSDNQIALVHKKGVNVYDCRQTPGVQKRPPVLTIFPSRIDVSHKLHDPDTGSITISDLTDDEDKQHIFDLMRDSILRPHGFDTTVFHNYVTKAAWSPLPVFRGQNSDSRCIIGVLTSTHQLLIFGQRIGRRLTSEIWTEPWEVILDVTAVYNEYLCSIWADDKKKQQGQKNAAKKFDTYKHRLYQLTITNFLWIPDWKLDPDAKYRDEVKGVFKSYFMTFHASGDVCIWKLVASKTVIPKYAVRVVYRKSGIIDDDIVSASAYSFVNSDFGLLLVGTNKGKILSYIVDKLKPVKDEESASASSTSDDPTSLQKYSIGKEQILWAEDMIRVEHLLVFPISSGRRKLDMIAVKNPNILIATTVSITAARVSGKDFSILKVPFGPIVGISQREDKELLINHEPGVLSLVSFKDGELECVQDSAVSIFDPQKTLKKKLILIGEAVQKIDKYKERKVKQVKDSDKRLIFQGLGLSPNKTLVCVARTVGVYYDHLQIRKPTQLVFYSLLPPPEDMFTTVRQLFAENSFSLRGIVDVLIPFRFSLRGKSSSEVLYKEILTWAAPLAEKSMGELQLLLWCLRVCPKSDVAEWEVANAEKMFNPESVKRLEEIDALYNYRIEIVTDRILQRRCESLMRAVLQNQDRVEFSLNVEINKQCLQMIHTFLKSKDSRDSSATLPPLPQFKPPPLLPTCNWCKGPLEFPLEVDTLDKELTNFDEDLKTDLDREEWSGFKWNTRRHPVKEFGSHKPETCALTLLPLQFPYRRCSNCFVAALIDPAFGQLPYCPLCNAMMYPNQAIVDSVAQSQEQSTAFNGNEIEPTDLLEAQTENPTTEIPSDSESEYVSDSSDG